MNEYIKDLKKALKIIWLLSQDDGDLTTKEDRLWLMRYLSDTD